MVPLHINRPQDSTLLDRPVRHKGGGDGKSLEEPRLSVQKRAEYDALTQDEIALREAVLSLASLHLLERNGMRSSAFVYTAKCRVADESWHDL